MLWHRSSDFGLIRRAIPIVAVAVLAKLGAEALGWDTVEVNTLHSGLVAASVFLIGFLLAGTLADYKESEKLPGELAGRTETLVDECQILYREKAAEPARKCIEHLADLSRTLGSWLRGKESVEAVFDRLEGLNRYFLEFQPLTQPNFIVRLKQEQSTLRLLVIRINTIRETSFVGAGYVIAEITSLLVIIALMFTDIAPLGVELLLVGTITFLLSYMIMLIRDLDDPFEYDGQRRTGTAEVSLAPLAHLQRRLERELGG